MSDTTPVEYPAQVLSPVINGGVRLTIGADDLTVASSFDAVKVPFAAINAILTDGFTVSLITDDGRYDFSQLGSWCTPFYDALTAAYNQAVLRCMFVSQAPVFQASGDYQVVEGGATLSGQAPVQVYGDAIVALPPNLTARRAPLCFATAFDVGDFEATLRIGPAEAYTYAKLGSDTAGFAAAVQAQLRVLREQAVAVVLGIDPSLTPPQAAAIAKLLPSGAAAPMAQLAAIAPSFNAAIEARLADTAAAEEYPVYRSLSQDIWVGVRQMAPDQTLWWLIVASPSGQAAAVEFAMPDSATFVYRTGGDFAGFAGQLNRALEAIDFKREVIWTPDDQITDPAWRMAIKRTSALQFVRANFVGRAIHTSGWQTSLTGLWGDPA